MKIKKGDTVKIIVGKDAGKTGKIVRIYPDKNRVLLENLNLFKKHRRPRKQGEKGEIVSVPRPLSISNVMLVCSTCKKPVRVGFKFEGEYKIRICKKCQNKI